MSEQVTEWVQGPEAEIVRNVGGQVHLSEAPLHTSPQHDTTGGLIPPPPLPPEPNDGLTVMYLMTAEPDTTGSLGVEYAYNQVVLFHFAWAQVWYSSEKVRSLAVSVIDDDGDEWRTDEAEAIRVAFIAANPDAYSVQVEWEDWDFGEIFGEHHNRQITFYNSGTGGASEVVGVEADPISPKPDQIDAEVLLPPLQVFSLDPDQFAMVGGTYLASGDTDTVTSQADASFSLAQFAGLEPIDSVSSLLGASETVVSIDDSVFDDCALEAVHQYEEWRRTRTMLLWVVPDAETIRRFYHGEIVAYTPTMTVASLLTPPRHRIRYYLDTVPYRRLDQRGDGLAGGARRVGQRTKTIQGSNRRGAGAIT